MDMKFTYAFNWVIKFWFLVVAKFLYYVLRNYFFPVLYVDFKVI